MLEKSVSNLNQKWRYLSLIPLILCLMFFFSCEKFVVEKEPVKEKLTMTVIDTITTFNHETYEEQIKIVKREVDAVEIVDTVVVFDYDTYEEQIQVVRNELNPEDVNRFRIKEVWFFDEQTSTLQARILGIAPMIDVKDENGNFRYEKPMFWAYYPDCREILARHKVFNAGNDAAPMTWEDTFEMRFFSSYIMKASNVHDYRLQDTYSGVDLLLEADKIKQEIFNWEHDLWSY